MRRRPDWLDELEEVCFALWCGGFGAFILVAAYRLAGALHVG